MIKIFLNLRKTLLVNKIILELIFSNLPFYLQKIIFNIVFLPKLIQWKYRLYKSEDKVGSIKAFDIKKSIFIHIPKAAGVSVKRSIFGENFQAGHHFLYKYELIFSKKDFNNYFKFTIVRNPWDRLFSAYNFLSKGGLTDEDHNWFQDNLSKYKDFDDFVKKWVNRKNIYRYTHFIPQYHYIRSSKRKIGVDFIGKLENIESDFIYISNKLNLGEINLKYINKTEGKANYKKYYNEQTIQIVRQVYKQDIELFNYEFED